MRPPKSELGQRRDIQGTPEELREKRDMSKEDKIGPVRKEQNLQNQVSCQPKKKELQDEGSDYRCQVLLTVNSNEDWGWSRAQRLGSHWLADRWQFQVVVDTEA